MQYKVLRIDEQMYGCEEPPADQPVLCDVLLEAPDGRRTTLAYPDEALTADNIQEGCAVLLQNGHLYRL